MSEQKPLLPGKIRQLSQEVIGQIAAGEVVENPAAAIKEMVENSIDAGATAITVEIREGGIAYIRVTDNGCGIAEQDIRMAFARHATSKLRTAEELTGVKTLGFRGEALASIAAVAKVQLTTRAHGQEQGVGIRIEGGVFGEVLPASSPEGTSIIVEDLFYNTPVRLKFLKKPRTEAAKVAEVVQRQMLSHPEIGFRFLMDGKQVTRTSGNGKGESVLHALYGPEVAGQMLPVSGSDVAIHVDGWVGVGSAARSTRNQQSFFLNGRYIRHQALSQAMEQACRERVTIGHYPVCVLHLRMPGEWADVNVHPNKLDVRFRDEQRVAQVLYDAVQSAFPAKSTFEERTPEMLLGKAEPRSEIPAPEVAVTEISPPPTDGQPTDRDNAPSFSEVVQSYFASMPEPAQRSRVKEGTAPFAAGRHPEIPFTDYPKEPSEQPPPVILEQSSLEAPPEEDASATPLYFRLIGVVFSTYLILEMEGRLWFIDQHAAHERILYERLMRALEEGQGSQQLLTPDLVPLTPTQADQILTYQKELRESGFEVELMGHDAAQLRAVPMVLGEPQARLAFLDVLEHLGELRPIATRQKRRDAILQMACKKAIKAGDNLSHEEIEQLLREMKGNDAPPTCPHGRPLVVALTRRELEKRFKRVQ